MGETCGVCGRPKGDPHRYPVAGECTAPDATDYTVSLQCMSIALRKAQEALAAARRAAEDVDKVTQRYAADAGTAIRDLAAARREIATERYEHRHTIEQRDWREKLLRKAQSALRHVDTLLQGKSVYRELLAEMDSALASPAAGEEWKHG